MKTHIVFVYLCISILKCHVTSIKIPQSRDPKPLSWWQQEVIYQIYPRSFQDSDGDGIGDLQGITSRVNYLAKLGIGAVWFSPIYPSPMKDFGYDISNFTGIEPYFGTLESFFNLSSALQANNIRLILDFVPNHTSEEHPWFNASIHKEDPYTNYYVWKNASSYDSQGRPLPPNNWVSVFGGSMWEWNEKREQFYLHQFLKEQPDLNLSNHRVVNELLSALKVWLDRGVDGFRVDAVPHLFEDLDDSNEIKDEQENLERPAGSIPWDYAFWDHRYTYNLPGCLDVLAEMRQFLDVYSLADGKDRVMMVEATVPTPKLFEYYGTDDKPVAHFPFNFDLINDLKRNFNASDLERIVTTWFGNLREGQTANWLVGNHDNSRVATRFGEEYVDLFNMLVLLLPGNAVTYYGEEIGMANGNVSWEKTVDPSGRNAGPGRFQLFSRDPERTPMQFNDDINAGFSTADEIWLPVNSDYTKVNVKNQENSTDGSSHLEIYKKLIELRNTDVWRFGSLETKVIQASNETMEIFGFSRVFNSSGFVVLLGIAECDVEVNISKEFSGIPPLATVYASSTSFYACSHGETGNLLNTSGVRLHGKGASVFTFNV